MRAILATVIAAFAVSLALTAAAQPSPPPKLEPVPEAAPPPPEIADDTELQAALEAQLKELQRANQTVVEYRHNGRLSMVKVTPQHGHPYYLLADAANGGFIRRDSLDSGLKVPMWVLFSF
jgi:hypothetical protein